MPQEKGVQNVRKFYQFKNLGHFIHFAFKIEETLVVFFSELLNLTNKQVLSVLFYTLEAGSVSHWR